MDVDRTLALISVVVSAVGILLTLLVLLRTRLRGRGRQLPADAADVRVQGGSQLRRRAADRAQSGSSGEIYVFVIIGALALWVAGLLAVLFADLQQRALRIAAVVAIVLSVLAIGWLVVAIIRGRRPWSLPWLVLLFAADAVVALAPRSFVDPWGSQGRFTDASRLIPQDGTVQERAAAALKIYGLGYLPQAVTQSAGLALVLIAALAVLLITARQAFVARQITGHRHIAVVLTLAVVLGFVLLTGLAAGVPATQLAATTITAGQRPGFSPSAAPLALVRDGQRHLFLLIGRCGADRVRTLSVDGQSVNLSRVNAGPQSSVTTVRLDSSRLIAPITIVFASTRSYQTDIVFNTLPKRRRFLPVEVGQTRSGFSQPGQACA